VKPIDLTDCENLFDVVTAIHERLAALEAKETVQNSVIALKDIESFIEGRMKCAIPVQMLGAYRDVLFLVRQHINATKGPCDHSSSHHHEIAITKCDICFKEWI
jgi:hypothetical protein